jgi:DNA polymerase III subunit beta
MGLSIIRETLLEILHAVIGAVEPKPTLPILSNVLLNIEKERLSVTANNLGFELVGKANLLISPEQDMSITLPARKLFDICKKLPAESVIELLRDEKKSQMIVKSGKSRFALSTISSSDFPSFSETEAIAQFNINNKKLAKLLQRSIFATPTQDVRYYLNGILIELTDSYITCVGTDGHRLAMNSTSANVSPENKVRIILPRDATSELIKLLNSCSEDVTITVGKTQLQVHCSQYVFTTKLIDHVYPDYRKIIPNSLNNKIKVKSSILKSALQRSTILSNEKFKGVRLEIQPNLLNITAHNPEHESSEEHVLVNYNGESFNIGFNASYLLEKLNIIESEEVILNLQSQNTAMLIEETTEGIESIFITMPMRL